MVFMKNCAFILTYLNFSHLQSILHLMQYTDQDIFFHYSKQFLSSLTLIPFSASAIFVSPLPHQQNVSLSGLFYLGKPKKKVTWGEIG